MFKTTIIRTSSLVKMLLVSIAAVAVVGCATDPHVVEQISHAEAIAMEKPDSALIIMRSIDPTLVRGRHDNAHYNLVYSESLYYNAIDSDNDSITRPMVEYYMSSDNHAERARAMYQHAQVMMAAGEYAESMIYCMEAEQSLAHLDNPRLSGLVHRTKGLLYCDDCLNSNAIEEFELAKEYFYESNLKFHWIYSVYDIGEMYMLMKEYDKSIEVLLPLIDMCIQDGYIQLLTLILNVLSDCYIETDRIDGCRNIVSLFETHNCKGVYSDKQYYFTKAIIAASDNDREKAMEYLNIANGYPLKESVQSEFLTSIVYKKLGELDKALHYMILSEERQDEMILEVLTQPVLNLQIELLQANLHDEHQRVRYGTIIIVSLIVVLILLVVLLLLYLHFRNVKQARDVANYISIINELRHAKTIQERLSTNASEELSSDDILSLNEMCEIIYVYEDSSQLSAKLTQEVMKRIELLRNDESYLGGLEHIINARNNNIFVELRNKCPKLNSKEMRFILYYFYGFSSRSMSILLGIDTTAISRLKYKLKVKLKESGNQDIYNRIFEDR
ncbi:MAG: hypothetical protein J6Q07_03565 [Alistipes sp.]|nr:hypothetical protein [Alistipes sp.]